MHLNQLISTENVESGQAVSTDELVEDSGVRFAARRRAQHLFESSFPMWIFECGSGRIVAVNDAAAAAYGYTPDQLLACNLNDICCLRSSAEELLVTLASRAAHAKPWIKSVRHCRKDGSTFHADVSIIGILDSDEANAMVLVHRSTRKRAKVGDAPSRALESVAKLRRLADDPRSLVALDAGALAKQVRERVLERAEAKGVDIHLNCVCRRIWVQLEAFAEALYELLENAVRATRRGHPVMVDARDTSDGGVVWNIQDMGEGIPRWVLADLGQELPRGGSGLGVAFAGAIAKRHGGSLSFESAPGVGTTATIWLPGRR